MAQTSVDICNGALLRLGESFITSLSDGTPNAERCKNRYDIARRSVLRSHPWKRLRKRAQLARSGTKPAFQWSYQYPLPADCLRVFLVTDNDGNTLMEYEFETNAILTDEEAIYLKYVRDEVDVSLLDDLMNDCVSAKLALDLAYQISGDKSLIDRLSREYRVMLAEAKSIDSKEDYQKTIDATDWIDAQQTGFQPTKYPNLR